MPTTREFILCLLSMDTIRNVERPGNTCQRNIPESSAGEDHVHHKPRLPIDAGPEITEKALSLFDGGSLYHIQRCQER